MAKKFVTKKKKRIFIILKVIMLILLTYVIYKITFGSLLKIKIMSSNEEFLKYLISDTNHHIIYKQNSKDLINKAINFFSKISLNEPTTILKESLNLKTNSVKDTDDTYEDLDKLSKVTSYIEDPNPTDINKPLVYIYNSHQLENYSSKDFEGYDVTPNVMMASYLLKEKLNKLGIPTIVETSNITEFMRVNNWSHADSYKASRFYILETLNNNPDLKLIIDLHRDALNHELSTVKINGKNYAKILFVVGLEHKTYEKNLNLANQINKLITLKYEGLSRGIIKKEGINVDGIYNQDLSPNMVLIEVGGNESTIEEVMNTTNVLSEIIKEYLGGTYE